jgi:hypothetical protein
MLSPNSTTADHFCCNTCGGEVAIVVQPGGDITYQCQDQRCERVVSVDCPEALQVRKTREPSVCSFEVLSATFDVVFADLYAVDGDTTQVGDDRMEAMNVQWFEVLATARWIPSQWTKAVARAARLAA